MAIIPRRFQESMQTTRTQQRLFVLTILVPMLIIFGLFWFYPILSGFYGSMTDWRAFEPERNFVGLRQYERLLNDPVFRQSVVNTITYTIMYVPLALLLSLGVALGVNAAGALRGVFRTVYFIPVVTSVIATAIVWNWLYQPRFGLLNQIFAMTGLPQQTFLKAPDTALFSIVIYALWKTLGYNVVLFMAGLSAIPQTFAEAAKVDGANRWQVFWRITLPLLQPTMIFVVITSIIESLQVFNPIYVMTAATVNDSPGGPLNSTMVMSLYQYNVAFKELNLGYGSAIGIVLFLLVLVVTLVQARFLRKRFEY